MKNISKYIGLISAVAFAFILYACEPQLAEKPEIGPAPTAEQLEFTITPGEDDFHVVITNTSTITGIAYWDFGNGVKGDGQTATVKYSLAGDYTVKLTLVTNGGTASKEKTYTQTKTDFSIFTDPVYVNLSGGTGVPAGKTWVLDAETPGHLGVGPVEGTSGLEWWAASPFQKASTSLYDDEITFQINDFVATYNNTDGKSYVKAYRANDPALAAFYTNPVENDSDYDVDYTTPVVGTWSITEKSDGYYLQLNAASPIFPIFDVGAVNDEYKIVSVEENSLILTCPSSYEDWTRWHFELVPKGFTRPKITYDLSIVEGADNDVAFSVTNYSIPADQSVTNITWDFGDGSDPVTTTTKDDVVHHTFMRAGDYNATASINTSIGILEESQIVSLANNNSAYVPFQLDAIVMYNDFSEVMTVPVLGEDCSVTIVDNPLKVYPNKSSKVAFYSKTDQQWANAYMKLDPGYRFDLRLKHVFSIKVYGNAGDQILLKLENTDRGGNAWQTGTADLIYTIQETNKWEIAEYDFSGVSAGWDWTGDIYTSDVVTDPNFNNGFYNVVRIMCNPGNGSGTHEFYFDDLMGPHVEGVTK